MANNIISGPNAVVALGFADGIRVEDLPGVNAQTVDTIFEVDGRYRSWQPDRGINQFTTLRRGIGYLFLSRQGMDLSQYFSPPVPEGGIDNIYVVGDGLGNVIGDGAGNLIGYS